MGVIGLRGRAATGGLLHEQSVRTAPPGREHLVTGTRDVDHSRHHRGVDKTLHAVRAGHRDHGHHHSPVPEKGKPAGFLGRGHTNLTSPARRLWSGVHPPADQGEASRHVRQITASTEHQEGRQVVAQGEARREAREPGITSVHQATQGRVRLRNGGGLLTARSPTYRLMSGMAASATEGVDELNAWSKVVFSSTLDEPLEWENTRLVREDAVEAVRAMKAESDVPLSTLGSLALCRSLLTAGLVDRYRVVVFPVVTGVTGREHVYDGWPDVALDLIESRTFDGRSQMLDYRPRLLDRPLSSSTS